MIYFCWQYISFDLKLVPRVVVKYFVNRMSRVRPRDVQGGGNKNYVEFSN